MIDPISSKISDATFEHLDKNLPLTFHANEFLVQQYESLLKHLFGLFGEESTLSHTLAIKQGFKKFFEQSSQEISIHLDAKEIKLSKSRKKMLPFVEDLDDETVLGLNGYILCLNFGKALGEFADILLQKVLNRDKAADSFYGTITARP